MRESEPFFPAGAVLVDLKRVDATLGFEEGCGSRAVGERGSSGRNGCWIRREQSVEGWQRVGEMGGGIGRGMSGETPGEAVNPGGGLGQDETFGASRESPTTSPTAPFLLRVFWSGNFSC
jgi:hypothetical protein